MKFRSASRVRLAVTGCAALAGLGLASCGGGSGDVAAPGNQPALTQPVLGVRSKPILTADNFKFRDANGGGKLDPYEDWRLSPDARAKDLVAKMTLQEKAGMLMIDTLNAPVPPNTIANTAADRFINTEKMTRFIFRNTVQMTNAANVSPQQAAEFTRMSTAQSWKISPSLQDIKDTMSEASAIGKKVVLSIYFRQPYVLDDASGLKMPTQSLPTTA